MRENDEPPRTGVSVGLDSNVLLAVLLPNPGGVTTADVIACRAILVAVEQGAIHAVTSALALAEVTYALGRDGVSARRRRDLELYLTQALRDHLSFIPVDEALAIEAAEHRLANYHRQRSPISYADSLYVVTAWSAGAKHVATTDGPLLALKDRRIVPPNELVAILGLGPHST